MGLFDKLFGRKSAEEPKKEANDVLIYSEVVANGEEIEVNSLSRYGTIRHSNNSETELIIGRIIKHQEDHTVMNDEQDYIAFELPVGQRVTESILHSVVKQYNIDKSAGKVDKKACYVGELKETNAGVILGKRSAAVEGMVKSQVAKLEERRASLIQNEYQKRRAEQIKVEEMRVEQSAIRQKEYLETSSKERAGRLSNPVLRLVDKLSIGKKLYTGYDGVDMQTGDILRLRNVDKVCKDQNGQYLYTAYVNSVEHSHDAEMYNEHQKPAGKLVAFTLPGRLQDFVDTGRPEQIRNILTLLSKGKSLAKDGQMTYIGGIDAKGNINNDSKPTSPGIANMLMQMQKQYVASQARLENYDKER